MKRRMRSFRRRRGCRIQRWSSVCPLYRFEHTRRPVHTFSSSMSSCVLSHHRPHARKRARSYRYSIRDRSAGVHGEREHPVCSSARQSASSPQDDGKSRGNEKQRKTHFLPASVAQHRQNIDSGQQMMAAQTDQTKPSVGPVLRYVVLGPRSSLCFEQEHIPTTLQWHGFWSVPHCQQMGMKGNGMDMAVALARQPSFLRASE